MNNAKVYHGGGTGKKGFSGKSINTEDHLVAVTVSDSMPDFLNSKIAVTGQATKSIINSGTNEKINIDVPKQLGDHKLLQSATDTTPAELVNKVQAGTNLTLATANAGGDEKLIINATKQLGDHKLLQSATDTTPAELVNKVQAGTNLTLATANAGGDEKLIINATTQLGDHKVLQSGTDTTPNYLGSKLAAGSNVTLTILDPGANEQISIAATSATAQKESHCLQYGTGLSLAVGSFVPPSTDGSSWANGNIGHYVVAASSIKEISIMLPRFVSYSGTDSITFQIRRIAAATARSSSALTASSGVALGTVNILCPNTSGSFWYNNFGGANVNYSLNAGDLVFIIISTLTANAITGAVVNLSILDN